MSHACPVCAFDERFDAILDTHRERSINFRVERALELLAAECGAECAFASFTMRTNRTLIKRETLLTDPARALAAEEALSRGEGGDGAALRRFSFGRTLAGAVGVLKATPGAQDRARVAKAASRLDSLLFQVLVEFAHRNYVTAVDAALDRFSIDESLSLALELLRDYTGADTAGVVFLESGGVDAGDLRAIVHTPAGLLTDADADQAELASILRRAPSAAAKRRFGLGPHYLDAALLRRGGADGTVIGRAFAARRTERFDYFEKQLLDSFGWLADSRITNYHEMAARLREFLDPQLVHVIVRQPERYKEILRAQKHAVAMIYADITGFSRMTEALPVETTLDLVNDFLTRMQRVIFRHGGIYDKAVGDCVIALCGPPFLDGKRDDPARDSHAALCIAVDMIREMADLSARFEPSTGEPVGLAVGVHTGEVTVGEFGPQNSREYSALGPAMNLAARVQGLSSYNRILTTEATRRACLAFQRRDPEAARFGFKKLGPHEIKNMRAVMIYEVIPPAPKGIKRTPPRRVLKARRKKPAKKKGAARANAA